MNYRYQYLQNRKTLADSGTEIFDLNISDPLSALWVEVRCTNGATSNQANLVADCVSDIEIIDGSDVLCSIDGAEALALSQALLKATPYQLVSEVASNVQNLSVLIPFGRFIGDPQWALDPARFRNLQCRVKWNFATTRAVAATAFATGTGTLTVVAVLMEGAPRPEGFLMHKEFYQYTTAAGIEYMDLPVDWPYRSILFRANLAAYQIFGVVNNLKVTCDAGKFIPLDMRMSDLVRLQSMWVPPFEYKHCFFCTSADTIYVIPKQDESLGLVPDTGDTTLAYNNDGKGEGAIVMTTGGSADTADKMFTAFVNGYCPFRSVYLPFGRENDPTDWFNAAAFKSVRLEATGAVASGTGYLVISQARRY